MKRKETKALSYIDGCRRICIDYIVHPLAKRLREDIKRLTYTREAKQRLATDEAMAKERILRTLRTMHYRPDRCNYVFYTYQLEDFNDPEQHDPDLKHLNLTYPDDIVLTHTAGHEQRRFDLKRFREDYPLLYEMYRTPVRSGARTLTGPEIARINYEMREKGGHV